MLRIVHILAFLLLSVATFAQRMPVSVTTILTPPYSSSLSAMSESGSTRLMVNLLVNDVTVSELPVKLHIKMESAGVTIESLPTQAVAPMLLGGGEARVLTGDDFAQYLRMDNLNFKGFSKSAYQKTGRLPSGLWKISVSVRHYYTDRAISNVGTAMAWITTYKPPVLTSPKEGETAPSNAALPLTFSWQPSKLTGGAATVMYRLEMWERRVDGVPAQAVVASVQPVYTMETAGLAATVIPASLALEPGMKYCWRVTAFDPAGRATFEDGGLSEVRTFQYLEKCPEVSGLTIDLKDVTGYASWDADMRHSGGYNVEVYDDDGTYHDTRWGYDNKTCGIGGDPGKTWHVRVQGICNSQVVSGWSGWADFTTPEEFKPQTDADGRAYECGELPPPREIANRALAGSLQKGDTVEDERGTTKFIIHSATRNDDGSFRGLSYMKLSIWGVKVLGEYDKMMVNTDGVIIGGYAWRSVKSDALLANPDAIEQWADETALNIAGATYNNTIKDTIRLGGVRFETISREGGKYFALTSDGTKEEITSAISGKSRALVQDSEGHELVIDKDGEPMGVAEYRACGGSKILMRENIREKDSLVVASGNVKFFGTGGYLFDTYDNYVNAAKGYAERFPVIGEGDYRPAYACAESESEVQIKAEPYKNITFKTERGVPVICKDGMLSVTARGDRDTTSVYAYDRDNNILGKVNVLSYDKESRKVCLVPVNNVNVPNAAEIKAGLDKIFAGLMVDFEVTTVDRIEIDYKDKSRGFVHGGSGIVGVYNTDQRSAIDKLKASQPIDNETCYLFLVECGTSNQLDVNDNKQAVGGYMPRGYQFGFIYNQYDNARTIAHELCHGAFHLRHTFDELDFVAPEGQTDNLMDYAISQPTHLNHWQWKDIHQPKSVRFKWLQDEEGAESATITNPQEVIDDIIEKIRCAKASGRNKIFVGSYRKILSADSKTLNFKIECVLGDSYEKYKTYNLTFPYKKTAYNDFCYKYSFGEIYFIIYKTKEYYFERYINDTSFVSQVYNIRENIKSENISEALKVLYRSSYCVFEQLTSYERKQLIKGLSEQWTLPECDENMVLNLLRASKENVDDARDVLSYVFSSTSKIFKSLNSGMSDFNGYGSHSEFMKLLIDMYAEAYKEDLELGYTTNKFVDFSPVAYVDCWKEDMVGSDLQLTNGVYKWRCEQRRYDKRSQLWISENAVYDLSPLDIINVVFKRDVNGFRKGDVVAMPMFYYAYLLNTNFDSYKADLLDNLLLGISVLKAVSVASKGVKAILTVEGLLTVGDAALATVNKIIEAYETDLKAKFKDEKDFNIFKEYWKNLYGTYQIYRVATSINSNIISAELTGHLSLLNDGLDVINTYMAESSGFTEKELSDFNKLYNHIKIITNENNVVY